MTTLITGCSFVDHANNWNNLPDWPIDQQNFALRGRPGAGNTAIAANTIYELSTDTYSDVIVLWSGIRRLDIPVSQEYYQFLKDQEDQDNPWYWVTRTGPTVWYNSGGQAGLWTTFPSCPRDIKYSIKTQFRDATLDHLSNLTFLAIASVQNFCRVRNISYKMAFIYDIHADITFNEHAHGKIDTSGPLYGIVDWSTIHTSTNAYDWCHNRGLISDDRYHPSPIGLKQYFEQAFGVNIGSRS